jgi:antitoxin component YwqK of YwqJK toxin-antitoxin module
MFAYIILNENYKYGEIIGSWNNWQDGIPVSKPDFTLREFKFYVIDIDDTAVKIHYKLKLRDDEFVLIDGYTTENVDGYDNNVLTIERIRDELSEFHYGSNKIMIESKYMKFYNNGILRFNGFINMRQPFGFGTIYYENGQKNYEGNLRYGIRNGFGTAYYFRTGYKQYEGYYKNDRKHGYGVSYNTNGEKRFEGKWENDIAPESMDSSTETEIINRCDAGVMADIPSPEPAIAKPEPIIAPVRILETPAQKKKDEENQFIALILLGLVIYAIYNILLALINRKFG